MKQHFSQRPSGVFIVLLIMIMILTVVSGYFYRQKNLYKSENRKLIIQNDSVISVNMELTDTIRNVSANKNSSQSLKPGN